MERERWSNKLTFILAAVGSAVGLGNAWKFPGLAAKHGGGAFLLVYVIALIFIGIPLLMAEIAIARKVRKGAPGSMKAIHKKGEFIGWMAVTNAFFIQVYYAVVFAWVILMFVMSFKFANLSISDASRLWETSILTTGTTSGYSQISTGVLLCLVVAWASAYYCIRNGAKSVGKVVKYTVFLPILCLLILAVKGFTMPNAMEGLKQFFVPNWSSLKNPTLWIDAIGQVFYSLSVAMAIMFAYGSFLDDNSNVASDVVIIAFSDLIISILSGIVMFTTMAGVGMLNEMTPSGIKTAFVVYPQAIVQLSNVGVINAIFAYVFYFCLITLSIDSLFSIVEGVSTAVSDKFSFNKKLVTRVLCIVSLVLGVFYTTGAGVAWLDIVDNFINSYSLILTGILEAIFIGWLFKTSKLCDEINKNTKKFKMPYVIFNISMKFIIPIVLSILFVFNMYTLFKNGGIYGAKDNYSLLSNLVGGWLVIILAISSGFIIKFVCKKLNVKEKEQEC